MAIGVADRKLLWGRANNQCAFAGCSQELTVNLDDLESQIIADAGAVIGEEAHIRSGRVDGPRYEADFPSNKIDSYGNLLLLCPTHHSIIDKHKGRAYSVRALEEMRVGHEQQMRATRTAAEEDARRMAERLAASVQVWQNKMLLDHWQTLTWSLNGAIPRLPGRSWMAIFDTTEWLLSKDWPSAVPKVRESFERFADVLSALAGHLMHTFIATNGDSWVLNREYKRIGGWDPSLYMKLLDESRVDCVLTWCLVIELTRAANLVIRAVREEIDPFYRWEEGVLLARDGDGILNNMWLARWEYPNHEWGNALVSVDISSWSAAIIGEAAKRQVNIDTLNPYEMLTILEKESLPSGDDGSGAA